MIFEIIIVTILWVNMVTAIFIFQEGTMNPYGLSLLEIGTLILISEGKSIEEIVREGYPSMEKFDATIRDIMDKTKKNTWEELKVIGTQLLCAAKISSKPIESFSDADTLLKEHIEAFCELYDSHIKEHCIVCKSCYIAFNGYEFICPEQRRLLNGKKDWMDKLIPQL